MKKFMIQLRNYGAQPIHVFQSLYYIEKRLKLQNHAPPRPALYKTPVQKIANV